MYMYVCVYRVKCNRSIYIDWTKTHTSLFPCEEGFYTLILHTTVVWKKILLEFCSCKGFQDYKCLTAVYLWCLHSMSIKAITKLIISTSVCIDTSCGKEERDSDTVWLTILQHVRQTHDVVFLMTYSTTVTYSCSSYYIWYSCHTHHRCDCLPFVSPPTCAPTSTHRQPQWPWLRN